MDNKGVYSLNTTPPASLAVSQYRSNPLLEFLLKDVTELTSVSYSAYVPYSFDLQSYMRAQVLTAGSRIKAVCG